MSTPAPARYGQPLTDRELQCLTGAAAGQSNAEIGSRLFLGENTIKSHMRRLYTKLGANDRAHAVSIGYQRAILTPCQASHGVAQEGPLVALWRARAVLADWQHAGPPPVAHLNAPWWSQRIDQLAIALGEPTAGRTGS